MRKQICLFLPSQERETVDFVRSRIDPIQFKLIPAHITLCYDDEVDNWDILVNRLENTTQKKFSISFAKPKLFVEGGYYLPYVGEANQYFELREYLLGNSEKRRINVKPHITILHPKNIKDNSHKNVIEIFNKTLEEVEFDTVSFIGKETNKPWEVINEYKLR